MRRAPTRASSRRSSGAAAAVRVLERLLGMSTMEVEILQAARDEVKEQPHFDGVSTR